MIEDKINIARGMGMTVKEDLENLFLRRKPVKLLMALRNGKGPKYVSILAKETDCTYSHTVKLLEIFRQMGLLFFDKKGRVKFVDLTKEGVEISEKFEELLRAFSKLKAKKQK